MSSATEEAGVPETDLQTSRFRQRQRTRAAIVNAAAELLRSGRTTPGASEIAEAADVSRRTVYQHFPAVGQLLLDATLGLRSQCQTVSVSDACGPRHWLPAKAAVQACHARIRSPVVSIWPRHFGP
jgi:hemoglobin-like flavoprotein